VQNDLSAGHHAEPAGPRGVSGPPSRARPGRCRRGREVTGRPAPAWEPLRYRRPHRRDRHRGPHSDPWSPFRWWIPVTERSARALRPRRRQGRYTVLSIHW